MLKKKFQNEKVKTKKGSGGVEEENWVKKNTTLFPTCQHSS